MLLVAPIFLNLFYHKVSTFAKLWSGGEELLRHWFDNIHLVLTWARSRCCVDWAQLQMLVSAVGSTKLTLLLVDCNIQVG